MSLWEGISKSWRDVTVLRLALLDEIAGWPAPITYIFSSFQASNAILKHDMFTWNVYALD